MITDKIENFAPDIEKASEILDTLENPICVLGSSRGTNYPYVPEAAKKIGYDLAKAGYSVITGGGPGLMAAINEGAQKAGGRSVGICVQYPNFMIDNPYMDEGYRIVVNSVYARKFLFWKYAKGFVALPGGLGTLDEISECLAYMQTDVITRRPLVLADNKFWDRLSDYLSDTMEKDFKTIDTKDLDLYVKCGMQDSVKTLINELNK